MSVTEDRRIALLEAAHQHWGRDVAVTLMELLPPSGWGDVATRQRVDALERNMDLRFQLVDRRLEALEATLDARMDALGARLDARVDALDARVDALDARVDALGVRLGLHSDTVAGEFAVMRSEMQSGFATMEARTVRWVVGTGVALLGALSGLAGLVTALH
jgi:hypothetical protein